MAVKHIEGKFNEAGGRYGVVVSRWNGFITEKLKGGALDALRRHGIDDDSVTVAYCPGSYEIPLTAQVMAESGKFDAVIAIGLVIRGATSHYDFVAGAANNGVLQANLKTGIPVVFGVLTTENIEQSIERAGTKAGNKGEEAALTAIEMVSLLKQLKSL
jgi:6,7-dimethyl-8-ribityllumazine synthase